ncbi:short-chain dehydrogenase [Brevundimonas sp. LM2]|uniref:SDR family oxidoreductase n=1 Tax=Brevundimonas sp. LM2 TaxID=1938605 RepID=UPI00098393FA|nr:SDR family oxidoreductase [Brevundimonas sp. LM2]AQR63043.1 short-chain dehydrogenase [Brevundimonas sp. LM2]
MSAITLKPLAEQTIVITGATSGIGLATARRAAAAGAAVVLVARDGAAAETEADALKANGLRAAGFAADVGDADQVEAISAFAVATFGGFDTWVNNAGVGIYAPLIDTPLADHQALFQTNYWGVVHGSTAAVRHFQSRPGSGALINMGSIQSDFAGPLLGAYTASKHAVKGYTDALRIELLRAKAPISVSLIKPSAIGTPFPQHGRNLTGSKARLPPPLYAPNVVAEAVLHAAQTPVRALTVGAAGRLQVIASTLSPDLFDRLAGFTDLALLDRARPEPSARPDNLDTSTNDGARLEQGEQKGRPFSLYTGAHTHPALAAGLVAVAGLGALAGLKQTLTARAFGKGSRR